MWTRKELKEKAKAAFTLSYWKCVLTAFILMLVAGGVSTASTVESGTNTSTSLNSIKESLSSLDPSMLTTIGIIIISVFATTYFLGALIKVFLLNPLGLGCYNFFTKNHYGSAALKELGYAFAPGYGKYVLTLFLRNLFIALWSLLFIVPGVIKSYEYRMIPYILSENPDISRKDAFAMSKKMMTGQKWHAFVLDLSFILWKLLSCITCGIVGIFYVNPYIQATNAELYHALKQNA